MLLPNPFQGMVENHGALEAGQISRTGPEVVQREGVTEERPAQKVRSWRIRNKMRYFWGRIITCAEQSILNSSEIRVQRKAVSVEAKTRESTMSVTLEPKFVSGY